MAKINFKTIDEYIAAQPKATQVVLQKVRKAIHKTLPGVEERISYNIPGFKLNGAQLVAVAGWTHHYSIYGATGPVAVKFKKELARYELSKGTVKFPLDEPVPLDLIQKIVQFRADMLKTRDKKQGKRRKGGGETQLDRVRRICNSMPSSTEKESHGAPTFFATPKKGVFAIYVDNHHDDGHLAVWAPAPPGMQAALIEDAPKTYFRPPYVGPGGWIGIELDQVNDEALEIHIREAWDIARRPKTSR